MKFKDAIYLTEAGIIERIKKLVGNIKGKIVSSVKNLLLIFKKNPNIRLTTIETFEVPMGKILARVDTGATRCSIHATDIKTEGDKVSFICNGKQYNYKIHDKVEIKSASGISNRIVILMDYVWNNKKYSNIETNLADRSKLTFVLLVGRNLISVLKLPVYINPQDEQPENEK